jgi:hypothetical protein
MKGDHATAAMPGHLGSCTKTHTHISFLRHILDKPLPHKHVHTYICTTHRWESQRLHTRVHTHTPTHLYHAPHKHMHVRAYLLPYIWSHTHQLMNTSLLKPPLSGLMYS